MLSKWFVGCSLLTVIDFLAGIVTKAVFLAASLAGANSNVNVSPSSHSLFLIDFVTTKSVSPTKSLVSGVYLFTNSSLSLLGLTVAFNFPPSNNSTST